jgi:glycosyltransferase involved in cell wall biosynthesis
LGEGISNTVLEAMATGLPVIATRVGGNPELVDDQNTGVLVPVGNSEELARVLLDIANDKDKLSAMGAAGLAKVQKQFHWDITVANYLAVYDELLK